MLTNKKNINHKIKKIGLLGYPITHSLSAFFQNELINKKKLNYKYDIYNIYSCNFQEILYYLKKNNVYGLNITYPFKKDVYNYVVPDLFSSIIKSVNTIIFSEKEIYGYNTDGLGAMAAICDTLKIKTKEFKNKKVVIFGSGGTAASISLILAKLNCNIIIYNRTEKNLKYLTNNLLNYNSNFDITPLLLNKYNFDYLKKTDIFINTTSLEFSNLSNDNYSIWDYFHYNKQGNCFKKLFNSNTLVFDTVYYPHKTNFLNIVRNISDTCNIINGIPMLIYQGLLSFKLFTYKKGDINFLKKIMSKYLIKL